MPPDSFVDAGRHEFLQANKVEIILRDFPALFPLQIRLQLQPNSTLSMTSSHGKSADS